MSSLLCYYWYCIDFIFELNLCISLFGSISFCCFFRAIGTLSSDPDREIEWRHQIDQIISGAIEFGILFRHAGVHPSNNEEKFQRNKHNSIRCSAMTNSDNVFDLSCLSFPVARAACRYVIMKQMLRWHSQMENNGSVNKNGPNTSPIPDVIFITGSGLQHRLITAVNRGSNSSNLGDNMNSVGVQQPRSMFMREYIQYILLNDFGLVSMITDRTFATGTSTTSIPGSAGGNAVTVKAKTLKEWFTLS